MCAATLDKLGPIRPSILHGDLCVVRTPPNASELPLRVHVNDRNDVHLNVRNVHLNDQNV